MIAGNGGNAGHGGERYPRRWLAAATMIGAATMDLIDITIVNVALPTIRSDLDASGTQLQWVVSAYMLAFAAALIVAGSFGDVLGRKRIYWGRRGPELLDHRLALIGNSCRCWARAPRRPSWTP